MPGSTSFATAVAHVSTPESGHTKPAMEAEPGSVEASSGKAALHAEIVRLQAQVKALTLENERLKHGSVQAGPGEEAAASPEIQKLRERVQATLAKLQAAQPSTAAAGTTSLPDGLKDFTPLAKEPEIAAIAAGLHELELAVAQDPCSEAALAALREETDRLALATQAKIDERTAEARRVPTAVEVEAAWAQLMPRVREKRRGQETVDELQAAWEKASADDKPRLLREVKKDHLREEERFVAMIDECAAAILAGNRDFQKIYHAVYDVIRSGEAGSVEAAKEGIRALGQAVCGDPKQLQQRGEAAETVTLLADAAGALPAFAELVRCLSWATGAR